MHEKHMLNKTMNPMQDKNLRNQNLNHKEFHKDLKLKEKNLLNVLMNKRCNTEYDDDDKKH